MPGPLSRPRKTLDRRCGMKLLFDQNLSPGLVTKLAGHYPDSAHAASVSNAFVGAALARENRELVSDPHGTRLSSR